MATETLAERRSNRLGETLGARATKLREAVVGSLFAPIDIASLVFFRIGFGLLAFWHVWQLIERGEVRTVYIDPSFHFTYYGFDWVKPLPGDLMFIVFFAAAGAGLLIALGLFYRAAACLFFLCHTYIFLIEQSNYWNHYYLISLIAFLMIFVPANRYMSLDVARGAVKEAQRVPAWSLYLLMAQMSIVYTFAGIAKLDGDWLHGAPMDLYLGATPEFPFIGRYFHESWMVYAFAWGGAAFDLSIVPFLLWRRTRVAAVLIAVTFHLMNSLIFDIELFPFLAIALTLLFLAPSWPRLGRTSGAQEVTSVEAAPSRNIAPGWKQRAVIGGLAVYFVIQLIVPLRHYAFPGNVEWTNDGSFFSWRMLISSNVGQVQFLVRPPAESGQRQQSSIIVRLQDELAPFQIIKLADRPDMMVQFAHHLADKYRVKGKPEPQVFVASRVCFNGRGPVPLVEASVDLASKKRGLSYSDWLQKKTGPLPPLDDRNYDAVCK